MSSEQQLALPFVHVPELGAADFLAAESNAAALAWLGRRSEWPSGRLALHGPPGSGKTHLLHIWSGQVAGTLLSGPALRFAPPTGALAIDDADAAAERPLLHMLNAAAEAGFPVLLAGRAAPSRWSVALPDLASRLRAMLAVAILPAEESLLRSLLARLLAERQVALPDAVQDWLFLRLPRTAAAIREAASRLDHAVMVCGGRDPRAIARRVLSDMGESGDGGENEDFAQMKRRGSPAAPVLL